MKESTQGLRVLLVDDDAKFRSTLQRGLADSGITALTAADPTEAERVLRESPEAIDLMLLDVMMPERDGWSYLAELRAGGNKVPVIFLSARRELEDRVKGLQLGADDYVVKPFEFKELLARIEAVARRNGTRVLRAADLRLDIDSRTLTQAGVTVHVSPQEFNLLRYLIEERGRTLSRKELLERVWGMGFDPGTNVVQVQMTRLRRKLGAGGSKFIETVVGQGYRFRPDD